MDSNDQERFFDWFAGFVAGEGSFQIRQRSDGSFICELAILLRDDDLSMLIKIQETLGMGTLHRGPSRRLNQNPQALWRVCGIDDLVRLVEIFDTHSIRAKKQGDYEIWRDAVLEISKGRARLNKSGWRTNYDREYLNYLAEKLKIVRGYNGPEPDEYEPEAEQLELGFYAKKP